MNTETNEPQVDATATETAEVETNELIAAGTLFPGLTPERRAELERDLLAYIESDDPDSVAGDEWFRTLAGVDRQYVTLILNLTTMQLSGAFESFAPETETPIISPEPVE